MRNIRRPRIHLLLYFKENDSISRPAIIFNSRHDLVSRVCSGDFNSQINISASTIFSKWFQSVIVINIFLFPFIKLKPGFHLFSNLFTVSDRIYLFRLKKKNVPHFFFCNLYQLKWPSIFKPLNTQGLDIKLVKRSLFFLGTIAWMALSCSILSYTMVL